MHYEYLNDYIDDIYQSNISYYYYIQEFNISLSYLIIYKIFNTVMNEYKNHTSNYRYINLIIMIFSALCNSMVVQSLSIISVQVTQYFSISQLIVSLCALEFMILHPPFGLLANYILDRKGLKLGVSLSCIGVTIGALIRMLVNQSFYFVLIGNGIIAISNAFIINCPAKFAAVWFKPTSRLLVTSLIVFSNGVSGGAGSLLSPLFVKRGQTPEEGKHQVFNLILCQAAIIGGIMGINLFFFRGKPKQKMIEGTANEDSIIEGSENIVEQNVSEQKSNERYYKKEQPYLMTLKQLLTTKNYILILACTALTVSILNCFATYAQVFTSPFGYTSGDVAIATAINLVAGFTGSIVSSLIIKKTKKYKLIIAIEIFGGVLSMGLISLSLILQWKFIFWIAIAVYGFMMYSLLPGLIEYACEFMYPIGEATVAGVLIAAGQLTSFCMGLLQGYILRDKTKEQSIIIMWFDIGAYSLIGLLFWFTKEDLKRLNLGNNKIDNISLITESYQQ